MTTTYWRSIEQTRRINDRWRRRSGRWRPKFCIKDRNSRRLKRPWCRGKARAPGTALWSVNWRDTKTDECREARQARARQTIITEERHTDRLSKLISATTKFVDRGMKRYWFLSHNWTVNWPWHLCLDLYSFPSALQIDRSFKRWWFGLATRQRRNQQQRLIYRSIGRSPIMPIYEAKRR